MIYIYAQGQIWVQMQEVRCPLGDGDWADVCLWNTFDFETRDLRSNNNELFNIFYCSSDLSQTLTKNVKYYI